MSAPVQVMKFGGTSLGDAARIRFAAEIIGGEAARRSLVVVVSAIAGATNDLINAAQKSAAGQDAAADQLAESLLALHAPAVEELVSAGPRREGLVRGMRQLIEQAANLCRGTFLLRELTPRALDAIAGTGERLSVRVVAGALEEMGVRCAAVEATELIITDDVHGAAQFLPTETREHSQARLRPLLNEGVVPIVTGFIAATAKGVPTTLGRGGSDYSATILAAALDAEEVVIWTDVDGVLTADPRLVPRAAVLDEVSYAEAAELAHFGAKVLHPKTLRPVARRGIPVWIRNSFAPERPGTKITNASSAASGRVKAVTAIGDVTLITVGGAGLMGAPDIPARIFSATASARVNALMISQSSAQEDICLVIPSAETERALKALRRALAAEVRHQNLEHINVDPNVAIVAVVGDHMRGTPGLAGRVFTTLGSAAINIIAIAQGSSESNISFLVEKDAMPRAVNAIHEHLGLGLANERSSTEEPTLSA